MDIVVEGLVKQFQADHDLDGLAIDEAFEAFAGFCVLSSFYESDFTPDVFRIGGATRQEAEKTRVINRAVVKLLPTFSRIMAEEQCAGVPPGEMVRNRRFAEAVRTAVLPAQRRTGRPGD